MKTQTITLKCATIFFLLLMLVAPAASTPDAMLDRSRTQFGDTSASTNNYIDARFGEVKNDLFLISDISIISDYQSGTLSDYDFINGIDLLDDTTDVNVVLIHTHGGTSLLSSYLCFKDDSKLYDSDVNSWMDQRNGGFIFAGACKSAKYTDLGNEFIDEGFDTFFGYKDTVFTLHNARFYAAFFDLGTFTNVDVSQAARYAEDEVEDEFGDATDVADNRFIGNSNLCLRT
ncbi:hypothetical protein V7O62_04655 [Methanolobus sp. ZRKC2]|uniref:hypothetical protein n=1 Tax=Methanolobus sp. ZRKC2 TaxID=3125783 RepID=UPI0032437076